MESFLLRKKNIYGAITICLVILVLAGIIFRLNSVIVVDDAQLQVRFISIKSSVNGKVEHVSIDKLKSKVNYNDLVVAMNTTEIDKKINIEKNNYLSLGKKIEYAEMEKSIFLRELDMKAKNIELNRRNIANNINLNKLKIDKSEEMVNLLQNIETTKPLSRKEVNEIEIDHFNNIALKHANEISLKKNDYLLLELEEDRSRIKLLDIELEELTSQREIVSERRNLLEYELSQHESRAVVDGVVDEIYVNIGEYVQKGQRLYLMHSSDDVYIEAKFYESDFGYISARKSVTVVFDAYPDKKIMGVITKIGTVTDSQLNIIPSSKITSNFIRVRQKIPVLIFLGKVDVPIIPGLLATVELKK